MDDDGAEKRPRADQTPSVHIASDTTVERTDSTIYTRTRQAMPQGGE